MPSNDLQMTHDDKHAYRVNMDYTNTQINSPVCLILICERSNECVNVICVCHRQTLWRHIMTCETSHLTMTYTRIPPTLGHICMVKKTLLVVSITSWSIN